MNARLRHVLRAAAPRLLGWALLVFVAANLGALAQMPVLAWFPVRATLGGADPVGALVVGCAFIAGVVLAFGDD